MSSLTSQSGALRSFWVLFSSSNRCAYSLTPGVWATRARQLSGWLSRSCVRALSPVPAYWLWERKRLSICSAGFTMFTDETVDENGGTPALAGEILVAVEDVTKRYARRVAVEKLTLALRAGEVFGLVGANGGGKTTTLRILAGILKPDTGHGHVLGFDLVSEAGKIRERVGYMSQRLSLYADLSVFENLRFRAQVYGSNRPRAAAETAIDDFELTEYAGSAAGRLSGGWARRLQLAAALIHSPRLLLLDEPTAGPDATSRHEVWRRIGLLAVQGAGGVGSTHDLAAAGPRPRAA